ncbi:MAG: hypothetical protein IJT18_01000 [Oscillospiraceae bacterium]|nr:hypothetical protein [Oscillospiraceae bacterium]
MKKRTVLSLLCLLLALSLLLSGCSLSLPFGITINVGGNEQTQETQSDPSAEEVGTERTLPPVLPITPDTVTEPAPVEVPQDILPLTDAPAPAEQEPPAPAEPVEPDFERLHINAGMAVGSSYAYRTATQDDPAVATFGTVEIRSYAKEPVAAFLARSNTMQVLAEAVSALDGAHDLSGYEARTLVVRIDCRDDGASKYGIHFDTRTTDYYDIGLAEKTASEELGCRTWNVRSGGEDKPVWCVSADVTVEEKHTYDRVFLFVVPTGYDGVVCGAVDRGKTGGTESLLDGDPKGAYYFFRLV